MELANEAFTTMGGVGALGIFVLLLLERINKLLAARRNGTNGISSEKMIEDMYLGRSPGTSEINGLRTQIARLERSISRLTERL